MGRNILGLIGRLGRQCKQAFAHQTVLKCSVPKSTFSTFNVMSIKSSNRTDRIHQRLHGLQYVSCRSMCDKQLKETNPHDDHDHDIQRQTSKSSMTTSEILDSALTESQATDMNFPSDLKELKKERNNWHRNQSRHSYRPNIDPQETSVFLFPGQGSQFVGMGKLLLNVPGVKDIYDTASDILGYDLLDVCLKGPRSKLDRTIYCQPAVFVTSLAAVEKLRENHAWVSIRKFKFIIFRDRSLNLKKKMYHRIYYYTQCIHKIRYRLQKKSESVVYS